MRKWWAAPSGAGGETSFVKSSLALISGTVASQAIVFLLSPLLSRLFSPADFGDLANYNAWVSILGLASNLRYEHALIVAKNRIEMNRVMALAVILSAASVALCAVAAIAIYTMDPAQGYFREIRRIVPFVPLGILPAVVASLLMLFSTRRGRFRRLAIIAVVQVAATVALQIGLATLAVPNSLVLGALLGSVVACLTLVIWHLRSNRLSHIGREMTLSGLRHTAIQHMNFPRYSLAADAINVVVQQFVPVFLTALFNPVLAGLFSFSTRVVRVPIFVVSTSVSTVLRKRAGDQLRSSGTLMPLWRTTVVSLGLLAVVPFFILWRYAGPIFGFVFGDQWLDAGHVVRVLSPGIMLEFIALPLFVFFIVTQSQRYTFRIQVMSASLLLASLLAGRYVWNSFLVTCALISGALVVSNLVTILAALSVSRHAHHDAVPAA